MIIIFPFGIAAQRLKDFRVALSDIKPPVSSGFNLDHLGYRRCGQYGGTPDAAKPARLDCKEDAVGRYLFVYLPGTEYLTICEVEAYGLSKFDYNCETQPISRG